MFISELHMIWLPSAHYTGEYFWYNASSKSPGNSTDIFTLHAGSKVQITDKIGNWIHIQLANGNKGWMIKENCQEI